MSQTTINSLPDEVLEPILEHAMAQPMPLILHHFLGHKHTRDYETGGIIYGVIEGQPESPDPHQAWLDHQEPHRRDWALAGVCRRWRAMAKHAFFTRKAFATDLLHANLLAKLKLPGLNREDQELALALVRHLIFVYVDLRDAKEFAVVPRCVAAFCQLQKVDFALGFQRGNGAGTRYSFRLESRQRPEAEFVNYMRPLRARGVQGMTLDQVDIGWYPGGYKLHVVRKDLRRFVYPGLERMAGKFIEWKKDGLEDC
jgi:hypothetical protein